jgi:hypothetical protein
MYIAVISRTDLTLHLSGKSTTLSQQWYDGMFQEMTVLEAAGLLQ